MIDTDRREAYIKAYIAATLSPIEQENWRTVRRQRVIAERVYDTECKWGYNDRN